MKRKILSALSVLMMLPALAAAQDVMVTRGFTGLWDQIEHENQGINLQIVEQPSGQKDGVAYWFTYGDDMTSAWFVGIGPVSGNRIEMKLYEVSGVGFLENDNPDKNGVEDIGEMEIEFLSCDEGDVTFSTNIAGVGSGMFPIVRLTNMINTKCSGGISDDTPANVLISEQRISLAPARAGVNGSGHADFEERPDRTEFSVEVEDIADGSYRIFVGGVDRGDLVVALGMGETEFRSPVEDGKVLLTFNPRGDLVEVRDSQGAVLTSGDSVFTGGDDDSSGGNGDDNGGGNGDDNGGGSGDDNGGGSGDDNGGGSGDDNGGGSDDDNGGGSGDDSSGGSGGGIDFGNSEIELNLNNTGMFPTASGDARLRARSDRTDFSVEIEDVPVGSYGLRIGGNSVGTIQVKMMQDGSIEGELEFRNPVEPGKQLLNFDPRGQQIDVLDGATVILETLFPSS